MKTRQRLMKAEAAPTPETEQDDKGQATHRLTGITVKEVSIVDRGANKRKYLMIKEEKPEASKDAAESGDTAKADPPGQAPQPPAPPTAPAPPAAPQAPTLRISPELKAKVASVLRAVQERIGVISRVLDGSSETPGAAPPKELMDALQQLASMIQQAAGAPSAAPQPPAAQPPAAAPPPPAPAAKTDAEGTEKAGRKISAERLAQLKGIQDTIASLIADVSDAPASGDNEPEGGAEKPPAEKSVDASTTPNPELAELKEAVAGMATAIKTMTQVFQGQNQRIDALSKSRGESRQTDVDTPSPKPPAPKVVWDLDMARPLKQVQ